MFYSFALSCSRLTCVVYYDLSGQTCPPNMKPQNPSSAMQPKTSSTKPVKARKSSTDRHQKVDGRDRRIRLPFSCAETVFELQGKLRHKNAGETVDWVVQQAKRSVDAVLNADQTNAGTLNVSQPIAYPLMDYPYPMPAPRPLAPASAPGGMMFPSTFNGLAFPGQGFAYRGTVGDTPNSRQMGQPLQFQNKMQN